MGNFGRLFKILNMRGLYFKNLFMVNNLIHKVYLRGKGTRVFKYYINKNK